MPTRSKTRRVFDQRMIPLILLLLPLLFVPTELTNIDLAWSAAPRAQSLATSAAIFAIVAYSLALMMRFGGMLSVVHGALFGVGAYTVGIIVRDLGWDVWLVMPIAGLVAAAVALVTGAIALRTQGIAFIVITLALGEFLVLIGNNGGDFTGGLNGLIARGFPGDIGPLSFRSAVDRYYLVLAVLYATIAVFWLISRSTFARRVEAIRDNPELARSLGLNTYLYRLMLFVVSAAMAGIAGPLLLYHLRVVDPTEFGTFGFVNILLMVVMGGSAVLAGPALGAWLVIFIPDWLGPAGLGNPEDQRIVFGVLLLLFMLAAPQGIAGTAKQWYRQGRVQAAWSATLARVRGAAVSAPAPSPDELLRAPPPDSRSVPPISDPVVSPPALAAAPAKVVELGETLLEARGIVMHFGAVQALRGVDLQVLAGDIVGIIGPNGSGKTTLFNCISGFLSATDGVVTWRDRDITGWSSDKIARHGLVRTFQDSMLFRTFTVRRSCEVAHEALTAIGTRKTSNVDLPEDVAAMLDLCELTASAELLTSELPQGTARRLGIAMALLVHPELLLLDEPAAGLNDVESAELGALLLRIRDAGVTLVVVDHDMSFLMPIVRRLVVLEAGRLLAQGTPQEIQSNQAVISAYLGEQFAAAARESR